MMRGVVFLPLVLVLFKVAFRGCGAKGERMRLLLQDAEDFGLQEAEAEVVVGYEFVGWGVFVFRGRVEAGGGGDVFIVQQRWELGN